MLVLFELLEHVAIMTMEKLTVFNTLTRQKELFVPLDPNNVRMYVCGMTVYDYCHLGHARVMVVFDMISRWLRRLDYPLTYVRNITDIDDKIIIRAQENGESIFELTERFIKAMHEDSDALGVLRPDIEPKATDFIPEMLSIIDKLVANGKAYRADNGDVYYAVREFPQYGQLSGKAQALNDFQISGRLIENEDKRHHIEYKKDPLDFVLWKADDNLDVPAFDSHYGRGRPGWHIECSAMSDALFGATFDIHGGGSDLQFPHHENEIAQSCGAHHQSACSHDEHHSHVKYWLHNGFIVVPKPDNNIDELDKMSKSLGNFVTIRDILAQYPAEVVRFFILRAHYRSALTFSEHHLNDAKQGLTRLYTALHDVQNNTNDVVQPLDKNTIEQYIMRFHHALNDDFGTPEAIAVLFDMAYEINKTGSLELAHALKDLASPLGLLQQSPETFLQSGQNTLSHAQIEALIAERQVARDNKDWTTSDAIRQQLAEHGIVLKDSVSGTTWLYGN